MHTEYSIKALLFVLYIPLFCEAQKVTPTSGKCIKVADSIYNRSVYSYVTVMPEFPGGKEKVLEYFATKLYISDTEQFQGKILLRFLIDTDGTISNVHVLKNKMIKTTGITQIENKAMKLVAAMPNWKPGRCGDKKVAVQYDLPIIW